MVLDGTAVAVPFNSSFLVVASNLTERIASPNSLVGYLFFAARRQVLDDSRRDQIDDYQTRVVQPVKETTLE